MSRSTEALLEALDSVVALFLEKGYEHASIEDVVQATTLNRYAIYQEFGGKLDLFIKALHRFHDIGMANLQDRLDHSPGPTLDVLRSYFYEPIQALKECRDRGAAGSLVCQAAFEVAPHNALVKEKLHILLDEKRALLLEALQRCQKQGDLSPAIEPEAAVEMLLTVMFGLSAQIIAGTSQSQLAISVEVVFAAMRA